MPRYNTTAQPDRVDEAHLPMPRGGANIPQPPGGGNGGLATRGISGGPVFLPEHQGHSYRVVSWGITPCIGVDYQYRIDTASDGIRPRTLPVSGLEFSEYMGHDISIMAPVFYP